MRIIAVDWSGRLKKAEESLWQAEVTDGTLTDNLQCGRKREQLIADLIQLASQDPHLVVGFDFAFSFPGWWCEKQGWSSAEDVWRAMADQGESLLTACDDPFWGKKGKTKSHRRQLYRRTELEEGEGTAKSVFQVAGPGAVGTASIRGMPHLLTLVENGFSVWPFSSGWPRVVEIYPSLLTGQVNKGKWLERRSYLLEHFSEQPEYLLERAAGSEDAFDAAVSSLVMSAHQGELLALTPLATSEYGIEGKIWRP